MRRALTSPAPAPAATTAQGADLLLFALDRRTDEASAHAGGAQTPPSFGDGVARALGTDVAAHEERVFEDGEHKCRSLVSVRGADVFVLDALHGDVERSPNDKLCRLLFFLGALRDAGAGRLTAVLPYLCYARKERKTKPRDPVTTRYVAALFEAVGTDAVVTIDVHNLAAYQNAFRLRAEHLEARPLFVRHFLPLLGDAPVVVVSPDAGGMKRADALRLSLARALGRDVGIAMLEKRRSEGAVSGAEVFGHVAGATAIIVDDLVSTGTTLARTAQACRGRGAARVLAAATHGLFTRGAAEALAEPALERLVVVNTVPPFRLPPRVVRDRLTVLVAAPLFAEAIRRLHTGGSLVELLGD